MKTDRPLVSVVMGVYNTKLQYLRKAVESILTQTYENLEFVIVDDGSDDEDVVSYLNSLSLDDDRVKIITNKENIGLTRSLNIGIDNSSGKYIARMDSDDISLPERIGKQAEYMEDNPDISMTGTDTLIITDEDEQGVPVNRGHMSDQRVCEIHLLFENEGYAHPTFMLRKSFLEENGIRYREDMKRDQDFALTTDIIMAGGKRHLIEEPLLKYRIHDGQISTTAYAEQVECQARIGFGRLRHTFETLSDDECWAIARINHESQESPPDVIISGIKKVFAENSKKHLYDQKLIKKVFYYEWYRKFMRITRINRTPWGVFRLFSIKALPYVFAVKIEDMNL